MNKIYNSIEKQENSLGNRLNIANSYTKEALLEVIDALPLAIAVIDTNKAILFANKATYKFVNKTESQLIGAVGGEAFDCINYSATSKGCGFGRECLKCKLRKTLLDTIDQKKAQAIVEITMTLKPHEKRHLRVSTLPMVLNQKDVILLSIEDITKSKQYDQAIVEKEKLSTAIQTAGGVCHEINQPLMIISGYSELLLENMSEDDPKFSGLKEISKQVTRLGEITQKLMKITGYKTKKYLSTEIIDIDASSES